MRLTRCHVARRAQTLCVATRSRREAFNAGGAPAAETLRFGFERVLRDASQQDVFDAAAADAVAAALQGYNAAVRPAFAAPVRR